MRHTNFIQKNTSFNVINNIDTNVVIYKFTLTGGLSTITPPTPSQNGQYYYLSIDAPNEDCFIFVKWGVVNEILRIGDPDILLIGLATEGNTYNYIHTGFDGTEIESNTMTEIGNGYFYVEPTSLIKSFFDIGGLLVTLSVPYKILNVATSPSGVSDENFINTGYNMFAYSGNRHSYFDLSSGSWIDDQSKEAKASDLAKAVCYKYGLVWSDRNDPLWIGNYIKYLRTYYENADQKVFKLYAPSVTPENNSNNFNLNQTDENGNLYLRGVSILLIQDLDTGDDGSGGSIVPFRNK